jgi:hypothetical protein
MYILGCFEDGPQINMVNGALNNICGDAPIIAYLQVGEVSVGLTPKEHDQLCIGLNGSSENAIPSYGCGWMNECRWMDECELCFTQKT